MLNNSDLESPLLSSPTLASPLVEVVLQNSEEDTSQEREGGDTISHDIKDPPILRPEKIQILKTWLSLIWPVALTAFCQASIGLTDIMVLGHFDGDLLSVTGLATVYCSITNVLVWQGILSAMGTLVAQAVGSKNHVLAGEWFVLGTTVAYIATGVVVILWCFAGDLFQPFADFNDFEREKLDTFARIYALGLPSMTGFRALDNWLKRYVDLWNKLVDIEG